MAEVGCPIRKGGVGSPLQGRYTKSGGGGNLLQVHYEKWGGRGGWAIRFRSITKSGRGGGGGNSLQVHYEKWGEGNSQKLHKPGPAPHKRTLTLLGGGGGGVHSNPPNPPLATGLMCVHACMQVCGYVYECAARVKNLYV